MKNQLKWLALPLMLLSACAPSESDLSFQGTWTLVREDGLASERLESQATVTVSNDRFRVVSKNIEGEAVDVYDGKILRHQDKEKKTATSASVNSTQPLRFWRRTFTGSGVSGGTIAGRSAVLYQYQDTQSDVQLTVQAWTDAETGVLLKRIYTNYSVPMQMVMKRETEECSEIRYGPVDAKLFEALP